MPDVSLININNTDINIKDATARKAITDEVTAREAADANYSGENKIATVTGDYTVTAGDLTETADHIVLTAGDLTETADNIVLHGKKSVLIDSDGTYTEDIIGKRKITAGDGEEIYSGTHSEHVTGAVTKAYDNNVTESVDGTFSRVITGQITETHKASRTVTGTNDAENMTGIKSISARDIRLTPTNDDGAITYSKPTKDGKLVTVPYKDINGDVYHVLCEGSEISSTNKRQFIIIGDSYGVESVISPNWRTTITNLLNKRSDVDKVYSFARGSIGFLQRVVEDNFLSYLKSLENAITTPDAITDIVVCGGANDFGGTPEELIAAIQNFSTYCHTTFVNCTVWVGMIGRTKDGNLHAYRERVITGYRKGCLQSTDATFYINSSDYWIHSDSDLQTDGLHPTQNASIQLGKALYHSIITGNAAYFNRNTYNIIGDNIAACNTTALITNKDGIYQLSMVMPEYNKSIRFDLKNPITIQADSWTQLASIENSPIHMGGSIYLPTNVTANFVSPTAAIAGCSASIMISESSLFIKLGQFYTPSSYGSNISNIKYIYIPGGFTIEIPSELC